MTRIDWDKALPVETRMPPDCVQFEREIISRGRPVVIEGLVSNWPLVQAGLRSPRAALDRLVSLDEGRSIEIFTGPPEINGHFFYNAGLDGFNFERRRTTLSALADELVRLETDPQPASIYAGAAPIGATLPRLLPEIMNGLVPPEREQLKSLWIGNRTRVPAHWDVPQNLICCVAGRRRYIILPPEELPNLYVGPLDFTLAGQPLSLVDFLDPDLSRHPRFEGVVARAEVATLEPGDALYLPSMWWHHAESLDPIGVMVNFWWRDGPPHLTNPLTTLLFAALTLRDMPGRERAIWKAFFDHYVFEVEGDPFAHLSDTQRGVMGRATAERIARIKSFVARALR